MTTSTIAYFGYGSLVNLGSLRTPYISAHRATLSGWKRTWVARPDTIDRDSANADIALLSVEAAPDAEIDGLIIIDHSSSLAALDKREAMYSRVQLDQKTLTFHDTPPQLDNQFLYVADVPSKPENAFILRSYLDVVMQGYLQQYGEKGLDRFIATTRNFATPVLEDRDKPRYPRATALSQAEIALFEQVLQEQKNKAN